MMKDALYEKFTNVPTRPGRGGTYSYIKWQSVADRMNEVFGVQWSSEVIYQDVVNSNVVTRIRVSVLDSDTGKLFYQEGFGGAPMDDRQEAGNPFKAAYSKALKDACRKWGVGLYLEEDVDHPTPVVVPFEKTNKVVPLTPVPSVEVPTIPVPPTAAPNVPSTPTAVPPIPTGVVTPTMVAPSVVTPIETAPPVATVPVEPTPPIMGTPPMPPPIPVPVQQPQSSPTSMSESSISDVQKAAMQSILNIQGAEYEELVRDAFTANEITMPETVPAMDSLTYKEAVIVVKYGNDKFRKR